VLLRSGLANRADPSPADILIATNPSDCLGRTLGRIGSPFYLTDLLEHDGQVLIRYSIRNGTNQAYVPGAPQVVALKAPQYRESLYTLKSSQLGSDETHRVKSSGEVPIDVAKYESHSSRIEPGQETTAIVAIKLARKHTEPAVIRLSSLGAPRGRLAQLWSSEMIGRITPNETRLKDYFEPRPTSASGRLF